MPTRGTKYQNAHYLKTRYQERRAAGLCIDCPAPSPDCARCRECRRCMSVKRKAA